MNQPVVIVQHCPAHHWYQHTQWCLMQDMRLLGITVPAGFKTDGASVPRLLWWLFPPTGRYMAAAIVHDYLLQAHYPARREADRVFLYAMQALGVIFWRRWLMFGAVRCFGLIKIGLDHLKARCARV